MTVNAQLVSLPLSFFLNQVPGTAQNCVCSAVYNKDPGRFVYKNISINMEESIHYITASLGERKLSPLL